MSFDFQNCTEESLWRYVGRHLKQNGIDAVLVGGSVVSIYTEGAYQSGDLDFVVSFLCWKKLEPVMAQIGFQEKGRHFVHPKCSHLFVEYQSEPLSIGDETGIIPAEYGEGDMVIKILSPTDCIKDRLASYVYYHARECLDQALLVAQQQPFDLNAVKKWCLNEEAIGAYNDFCRLLQVEGFDENQ